MMNSLMNRLTGFFALPALLLFFLAEAVGQTAPVVQLKENIIVQGPKILLKDIADISAASDDILMILENTVLGFAPRPGMIRDLSRQMIESRIKSELRERAAFELRGPEKVNVSVASKKIAAEEIADVAVRYVKSMIPYKEEDYTVSVRNMPGDRDMPAREARLEVLDRNYANLKSMQLIYVGLYNGRDLFTQVGVPVEVRTFENVMKARKTIALNLIISADDVELVREETTSFIKDLFRSPEDVIGKRARSIIREGTIITARLIDDPPLVKRGEIITLRAMFGPVHVETKVEARGEGRFGDLIQVYNQNVRKMMYARVLDKNTVIITDKADTKNN